MKSRIIWAVIVLAAIAGFYVVTIRPTQTHSPGFSRKRPPLRNLKPPEVALPPLPEPVVAMPTLTPPLLNQPIQIPPVTARRDERPMARPEVPIQDNVTIDFSLGSPQVRTQGKDQETLERVLKEMDEATKGVTFPATSKPRGR
jgi:hypothetical protein